MDKEQSSVLIKKNNKIKIVQTPSSILVLF